MKKTQLGIAPLGVLALLLSLPANAGEKVTGRDFDFQTLSELTAAIPDKPGHSLKQVSLVWKGTGPLANYWVSGIEQQEDAGNDIKSASLSAIVAQFRGES